jgi:hypothetical protein
MTTAKPAVQTRAPNTQVAFDRGGGSRGLSHRRENPYGLDQPELAAAWGRGWDKADGELSL